MTRKNLMSIPCLLSEVIKYFGGGFEKRKTKTIQKNPKKHGIDRDVPQYFEHYLQGWD